MQETDTYKTIRRASEGLYKDKGSKFIALAYPVSSDEEVKELLNQVKKQYYDARHHCYAWALDQSREIHRMNDDGEPSGTAGKPIYGQILSYDITNVLIVVVRYFGGTKLGVRGLINAYKGAAQDALQNADIITKVIHDYFKIQFDYPSMNDVMKIIKDYDLPQVEHDFALSCTMTFSVPQSISAQIEEKFSKLSNVVITHLNTY